jgi:hypothetical protein
MHTIEMASVSYTWLVQLCVNVEFIIRRLVESDCHWFPLKPGFFLSQFTAAFDPCTVEAERNTGACRSLRRAIEATLVIDKHRYHLWAVWDMVWAVAALVAILGLIITGKLHNSKAAFVCLLVTYCISMGVHGVLFTAMTKRWWSKEAIEPDAQDNSYVFVIVISMLPKAWILWSLWVDKHAKLLETMLNRQLNRQFNRQSEEFKATFEENTRAQATVMELIASLQAQILEKQDRTTNPASTVAHAPRSTRNRGDPQLVHAVY